MTSINIRKFVLIQVRRKERLVYYVAPVCVLVGVKAQEYQLDYEKAFDFVEHVDLYKTLKEIDIVEEE